MSSASLSATTPASTFLTSSAKLEHRWDPNFYRGMAEFRRRIARCTAPVVPLRHSLDLVQYGISERATEEPVGVPMLRMLNLQDDSWDLRDLKYIAMSDEERNPYLLKQGDIIFNRTNSKELVGKCGVFNLRGDYVFASYLIRVRLKEATLLPDYLTAYLSSSLGRLQIDAISRQIAGMTNINAEEIRSLLVPMLSPPRQAEIVQAWREAVAERDRTLDAARDLLASVDDELLKALRIVIDADPPKSTASRIFLRSLSDVAGGRLDPMANQELRRKLEHAVRAGIFPTYPLRQVASMSKEIVTTIGEEDIYVGLENIDGQSGAFAATTKKDSIGTAMCFRPGQILFPKLRPYLNKVHLAAFRGVCSTEFHVLTPNGINPQYLTLFLRSRAVHWITSMLMTGNTLPRLQTSDIERLQVPVPPPEVQREICSTLEALQVRASSIRAQARLEFDNAKLEIERLILESR